MGGAKLYGAYEGADRFEAGWRSLVATLAGDERIVGRSVEGRPLWRFDLGCRAPDAPVVLLTALIHGLEVIGSVALYDVVNRLVAGSREGDALLAGARLVVMPILNPDALHANLDRLGRGRLAFQRKNARGVDLNRNFPPLGSRASRHPLAGSRWRWSPYYRGPAPFSEPETQAVRDVVEATRPAAAVGFHSFGDLLLYPWAHTRAQHPRAPGYLRLADAFLRRMPGDPYACKQASAFYPTQGDLDDWLDATVGTMAFTVEVSGLDARLCHPLRLVNPFCWMNPTRVEPTVAKVTPAVLGLLRAAVAA